MRLQHTSTRLTSLLAILALGLFSFGCDSSGLTGTGGSGNGPALPGQASAKGGPGGAGGPGAAGGRGRRDSADVRVAHLSPDAPGVDIYVGKEPDGSPTIGNLEYTNFAPNADGDYLSLDPGTYDIAVTPAGVTSPQDIAIDADGVELAPNKDYTILAIGELNPEGDEPGIQALPLVDNADDETALPPRDKTLVRFVHASPDAGTVDIAVDGTTLLSGVTFGTASGYVEAEPGERTIQVQKGGSTVLEVSPNLKAGTKVTAYVIGNASKDDGDPMNSGLRAVTSLEATSPAGTGPVGDDGDDEGDDEEEEDEEEQEDEEEEEDEDDEDDED